MAIFDLLFNPEKMLEIPISSFDSRLWSGTIYATVIKYMLRITTQTVQGRTKTYYLYQYRNTSRFNNVYTDKFEQLMTLRYILHKDLLETIPKYRNIHAKMPKEDQKSNSHDLFDLLFA